LRDVPANTEADETARRWSAGIASGDHAALGEFYDAWFESSVGIVRAFTGRDESFCLDVVQSAMLKITRRIRPMDSEAALRSWVVSVLRSCAIDALRAQKRRAHHEAGAQAGGIERSHELAARIEWLAGMVSEADGSVQDLLRLRFAAGATVEQVAATSGRSPGAVHGTLRRLLGSWKQRWMQGEEHS